MKPHLLRLFLYLIILAPSFAVAAENPPPQAPPQVGWTEEQRQGMINLIQPEVKKNEEWSDFNNNWAVTIVILVVVINGAVAIGAASLNSEIATIKNHKALIGYGSAVLSVIAGVGTTILQTTKLESKREFYERQVADLKSLEANVRTGSVEKKEASTTFAKILEKRPNK